MFKSKKAFSQLINVLLLIGIIFITALAAGVLLESVVQVENFSLANPSVSNSERALKINEVVGDDIIFNQAIDRLYISSTLVPGSSPVDLNNVKLSISSDISDKIYFFNPSINCNNFTNTHEFGVERSGGGFITDSDFIKICVNSVVEFPANSEFSITLEISDGSTSYVKLKSPEVIYPYGNILYP